MESEIKDILMELNLLPIQQGHWKSVDFHLYSDSSVKQYDEAKHKIRVHVPGKTKGIYVLMKGKEVLYIGESGDSIQKRMIRHIEKIYSRTDKRSIFFKQRQHQGNLSYFYLELTSLSSTHRKLIEESMNLAVKPSYLTWTLKSRLRRLDGYFSTNANGN